MSRKLNSNNLDYDLNVIEVGAVVNIRGTKAVGTVMEIDESSDVIWVESYAYGVMSVLADDLAVICLNEKHVESGYLV